MLGWFIFFHLTVFICSTNILSRGVQAQPRPSELFSQIHTRLNGALWVFSIALGFLLSSNTKTNNQFIKNGLLNRNWSIFLLKRGRIVTFFQNAGYDDEYVKRKKVGQGSPTTSSNSLPIKRDEDSESEWVVFAIYYQQAWEFAQSPTNYRRASAMGGSSRNLSRCHWPSYAVCQSSQSLQLLERSPVGGFTFDSSFAGLFAVRN